MTRSCCQAQSSTALATAGFAVTGHTRACRRVRRARGSRAQVPATSTRAAVATSRSGFSCPRRVASTPLLPFLPSPCSSPAEIALFLSCLRSPPVREHDYTSRALRQHRGQDCCGPDREAHSDSDPVSNAPGPPASSLTMENTHLVLTWPSSRAHGACAANGVQTPSVILTPPPSSAHPGPRRAAPCI